MPLQQNIHSAETLLAGLSALLQQSNSARVLADVAGVCWLNSHLSYFDFCKKFYMDDRDLDTV